MKRKFLTAPRRASKGMRERAKQAILRGIFDSLSEDERKEALGKIRLEGEKTDEEK